MFLCFAYTNLCKTCDPREGLLLNQVTFKKLGKGLLDDSTYKISRLIACSGPDKCQCKDFWVRPFWS